ncbi:hypothetical protein CMUS01_13933 [Colletotrichum musicola]|uniref:Radical SAM core domain-containing protein n=1 Tax=Colletotrichum musicola TaxID=2175873 RepID=A0A8H6MU57_9PEZI|nr:hypothetical protein CMUS01_13933 [Colletotrichum musicola]
MGTILGESAIQLVDEYLTKSTWTGAENANSTYSHQGLMQYVSGHVVASYWRSRVYTPEVRQYMDENRFHIHDLGFLSAYCSGWSIEDILLQGFGGVDNKIQCRPPKHLNTALNQTVDFLFTLQGELAGAQALFNFDTYLAPFIRADGLTENEVFKCVQSFVYSLNVPTRAGFQAPFTNISLDLVCPAAMRGSPVIIGGEAHAEWTYDDFQAEMDLLNSAFTAVMVRGDGNGNIFSFPIPTYNLAEGFDWESPRDLNPEDFRSMCCRLRLDVRKLHSKVGGLFGAQPLTGYIGVVTLNLPNLALRSESGSKESFLQQVADACRVAKDSLEFKRRVVDGQPELYPYAAHYFAGIKKRSGSFWTNHFSTIGVCGMNEALSLLFGEDEGISSPQGQAFALETLEYIKDLLQEFQNETGHLFNLEATPAESTAYKLAQKDRELFPAAELPAFYTNSTMLPVGATDDVFAALEHQEPLQGAYTGGTVFHAFLGERLPTGWHARDLLRSMAERYRVPYVTLTPTFSICRAHGAWNRGKKVEFKLRKTYRLPGSSGSGSDSGISLCDNEDDIQPIEDLPIAGFNELTLSDWPGKAQASIMLTSRCNLSCGWCHEGAVVDGSAERESKTAAEDVLRKGVTVKLDSNGTNPDVLRQVFQEGLVDFVAMDIKARPENYKRVARKAVDPALLESSIGLIKESGVPHQFWTTVVPDLVDIEDILAARCLAGRSGLQLQRFRKGGTNLRRKFRNHREHTDEEWAEVVAQVGDKDVTENKG